MAALKKENHPFFHSGIPVPASCRSWVSSVVLLQNTGSQPKRLPYLPHFKSGIGLTLQGELRLNGEKLPSFGTRSLVVQNGPLEASPGLINLAFRFKEGVYFRSGLFSPAEFHQELSIDGNALLPESVWEGSVSNVESAIQFLENAILLLQKKGVLQFEAGKPMYHQKVSEWANSLGLSERSLERKCLNQMGLKPKAILSLSRFRRFLNLVYAQKQNSLLDCALDAGYYDQAHFIHAFKKYAGQSPKAYFENSPLSDFYNT